MEKLNIRDLFFKKIKLRCRSKIQMMQEAIVWKIITVARFFFISIIGWVQAFPSRLTSWSLISYTHKWNKMNKIKLSYNYLDIFFMMYSITREVDGYH